MWHIIGVFLGIVAILLLLNKKIKSTRIYLNFYRQIHVVKDVKKDEQYSVAAFGSTYGYYAFELKEFNGHNFSIEPQSIAYMRKTVHHFIKNVEPGGTVVLTLAGCSFPAGSIEPDESCLTYYAFLRKDEFQNYRLKNKVKYYLKRYFPIANSRMLKSLLRDVPDYYATTRNPELETAKGEARRRLSSWKKITGLQDFDNIVVSEPVKDVMRANVEILKSIIQEVKDNGCFPVILILPVSQAFYEECGPVFFDAFLYAPLAEIEKVPIIDFLKDEEMRGIELYWCADCLNREGRKKLTKKLMENIFNLTRR